MLSTKVFCKIRLSAGMEELKRSEVGDHLLHVSVTSSRQSDSTTMRSLVPAGINQTPSHNASASAISADPIESFHRAQAASIAPALLRRPLLEPAYLNISAHSSGQNITPADPY